MSTWGLGRVGRRARKEEAKGQGKGEGAWDKVGGMEDGHNSMGWGFRVRRRVRGQARARKWSSTARMGMWNSSSMLRMEANTLRGGLEGGGVGR